MSVIGLASAIADSPQFSMLPVVEATRFGCAPVCCASDEESILAATVASTVVFVCNEEIDYKGGNKSMSTPILMEHYLIKEQLICTQVLSDCALNTFP